MALRLTHPPPPATLKTHDSWKNVHHRCGNARKSQKLLQLFLTFRSLGFVSVAKIKK